VVMKSSIFWDITPCSLLKINRRFGGTCLHLQGRRISHARNQRESRWQISCWFLASLILRPRRWVQHVPPKRRLTFNVLHGVTSQKMHLFILSCFPCFIRRDRLSHNRAYVCVSDPLTQELETNGQIFVTSHEDKVPAGLLKFIFCSLFYTVNNTNVDVHTTEVENLIQDAEVSTARCMQFLLG
jgi:ferredoxin-thioredoxin reductase catalytic subunit